MLIPGIHRLYFYKTHLWDNVLKWLSSVMLCFPPDVASFGSVLERLLGYKGSNLKNDGMSKACFAAALSHDRVLCF